MSTLAEMNRSQPTLEATQALHFFGALKLQKGHATDYRLLSRSWFAKRLPIKLQRWSGRGGPLCGIHRRIVIVGPVRTGFLLVVYLTLPPASPNRVFILIVQHSLRGTSQQARQQRRYEAMARRPLLVQFTHHNWSDQPAPPFVQHRGEERVHNRKSGLMMIPTRCRRRGSVGT